MDGHRNCGVCLTPQETAKLGGICPVCGKRLTIGVAHRVEALADRAEGEARPGARPYVSLAPLPQVIAACVGRGEQTKTVQGLYERLLSQVGPEFFLLRQAEISSIAEAAGETVAQGVRCLREGKLLWQPGFDGEYGKLRFL